MIRRILSQISKISWILLIVLLPISSFPLLSKGFGGTTVAPLSYLFLFILVLVWLLPQYIKNFSLPYHSIPIIIFICFAALSNLFATFTAVPSFREVPKWRNNLEGFVTLLIGIAFYLLIIQYINSKQRLKTFIRLVNFSGLAIILYSLLQAVVWFLTEKYPPFMFQIQKWISVSGILYRDRVTGFAFEPSWLAHQLNMLYLPIWIGMTIKGITAHQKRIWKVSIENILMVGGLLVLFLSFSRIGWLAMIAVSAYLFFRLMASLSKKWVGQISNRRKSPLTLLNTIFLYILIWLAFFLFIIALILAAGLILTRLDPRMAGLFNIGLIADKGILEWASTMIFAERLVYWIAGINVFFKYPIMGVGLGNAGYFFPQTFNAFSYKLTEIMEILVRDSFIPNAKNLWVRLLAETGIVGFSIFLFWLYIHWKSARFLEQSQQKWFISFGLVGQIFLVAFFMEGFSLDTFGLPYCWISMALIVAVLRIKLNHPIELPNLEI